MLSFISVAAFAAAPVIVIDAFGNVFRDGANTGTQVAGFVANNPSLSSAVDGAWRERVVASRVEVADAIAEKEAAKQDAITAHIAAKAAEIAALKARIAELEMQLADKAGGAK